MTEAEAELMVSQNAIPWKLLFETQADIQKLEARIAENVVKLLEGE